MAVSCVSPLSETQDETVCAGARTRSREDVAVWRNSLAQQFSQAPARSLGREDVVERSRSLF